MPPGDPRPTALNVILTQLRRLNGTPRFARRLAPNVILTQRFAPGEPIAPAKWAAAALCELESVERLPPGFADCPLPLLVFRPSNRPRDIAAGRAACDHLHRDLAPHGQFAGYIV